MSKVQYTQEKLLARINTILGDNVLIIDECHYQESIGKGFSATISCSSSIRHDLTAKDLVGTPATIAIVKEDNSFRHINAYINSIDCTGSSSNSDKTFYQIGLSSWLEIFASHKTNCRIYQDKTVEDVIKDIFSEYGDLADLAFDVKTTPPTRRYWVQYNESDLNFFNRICARDGLSYYFKHKNGKHTLAIFNDPTTLETASPKKIKLNVHLNNTDQLQSWNSSESFGTGMTELTSYNYMSPSVKLNAKVNTALPINKVTNVMKCENYQYREDIHNINEGKSLGKIINHKQTANTCLYTAIGTHREIEVGKHFELELNNNNSFSDQGKEFTVMAHKLTVKNNSNVCRCTVKAVNKGEYISPNFKAITIPGLQTAVVTGPAGEEIHTDKLGRIKAQFHWDREGKQDDNTSCWLRVMQGIAGSGFGSQFTPRIGQEVVVAFENGNPDRPFVIGSLYHQENTPPYATFQGTRNGIKTRSTKGGAASNCNELYFEDKKGSEEVFLQAEKDHNTLIKNDETRTINNNQSITIAKNQTIKTGGNHKENVSKSSSLKVGNELTIDAGDKITLKVGGSKIEITGSGIKIGSTKIDIKGGVVNIN